MKASRKKGFTLVELLVGMAVSGVLMAGIMSTFVFFARTSFRLSEYDNMERQATKGLELLARDVRMAQKIETNAPAVISAPSRQTITSIKLTVPTSSSVSRTVEYRFNNDNTFVLIEGGSTTVLVRNLEPGSGRFEASNLFRDPALNDYETNQVKVIMTARPDTKGNYAQTTKRVISARFVLRNR